MAKVDYFFKLDGIPGESSDDKHKGEMDILSYSLGATNSGTAGMTAGGGAGKVAFQDAHFTMYVNKASPKLMQACASGEHIKSGVLVARKAGKDPLEFIKFTFSDLIVSSYQHGGSSSGDVVPVDQFSINFAKIEKEYKAQKADGTGEGAIKGGWHVSANKAP